MLLTPHRGGASLLSLSPVILASFAVTLLSPDFLTAGSFHHCDLNNKPSTSQTFL